MQPGFERLLPWLVEVDARLCEKNKFNLGSESKTLTKLAIPLAWKSGVTPFILASSRGEIRGTECVQVREASITRLLGLAMTITSIGV